MEDIQSWYEVPSIAHFCSLFRAAFSLVDFDIEELEEALLTDGAEDMGSSLIQDLIVRLLNGCMGTSDVTSSNYQMFLRRLFRQKFQDGKKNPFNSDVDFRFLPLRTKVEILHFLCDCRLEADDVMEVLKNLEADSLRVEPLGYDDNKAAYWYFYGTRLYKEENALVKEEEEVEKSKKKGKKKLGKEIAPVRGPWTVACFTEEDWSELCDSLSIATSKNEKNLYRTLKEDFLPEIPNLFAEKERQQRKRMSDAAPRRASTRIEKLKQQREEQDRIVAVAIQAELLHSETNADEDHDSKDDVVVTPPEAPPKSKSKKIDEDEWLMLRNKADRATRALLREISRDNVDLFSSFESTRSVPTRASSVDSSVLEKGTEKTEKNEVTVEKPAKKDTSLSEKNHNPEKTERSTSNKPPKTPKQESENKPIKKSERPEKNAAEKSDAKSNKNATFAGDTNNALAAKCNSKKGRQTNNSLSSVIDTAMNHVENGGVKYRRVVTALSATTDEAKIGMYKILEQIKNHPDAWPFLDPVDEDFAPDYYTKISQPMDLEKMEQRVSTKYYQSVNEFVSDFDLIVDNCKKYNGPESEYSFMVESLADEFRVLSARYLNSVYEPDPIPSGSESDCSTASDESNHQKHKSGVPDARKRGGLMKLAQAFSGSGNRSNPKSTTTAANKVKLKTEDVWDTPSPDSSEPDSKNRKMNKPKEKVDKKKGKIKKPVAGGRNLEALNALAAATEQTLKDMKKWLDTPKFPEYSSGNSSSGEKVTAEEFETLSVSVEEEYRKQGRGKIESASPSKSPKKNKSMLHKKKGLLILASKGRLPVESKEEQDTLMKRKKKKLKKEKLMDSLFETPCDKVAKDTPPSPPPPPPADNGKSASNVAKEKEKPARKAFDRLQPGGKSKVSKVSRPDESKLSSVIAKIKESRSSALQKQTETIQKAQLSLGTVLLSEIGSNRTLEEKEPAEVEESAKQADQENPVVEPTEVAETKATEPVAEVKHSATPNLSAWFRAFGAPKNPIKRQISETHETRTQGVPPAKKGIGQHQEGNKDLPWYARVEKKDPPTGKLEPVSTQKEVMSEDSAAEESRHMMDPSSPADSLGSINSPASAESIRSPSTPGGGWGGQNNRYSAADNPAIRSPLTPETQSFSPSVPLHPIKVGFYQDMQKGASPIHVKSPSCHSNSSGTGPNSPNDHLAINRLLSSHKVDLVKCFIMEGR
ncbi:hypothetical protein GHT06_020649 [Daphnia sinensis]|uniref:Bromo domain-containing protein n=1 Tax=Daphnia sinensis TaxID=1820382 RepID=A0AAD5KI39_9CRUS|nr:hypothetical protein GHT06_020649 [Daphnia sinensis]